MHSRDKNERKLAEMEGETYLPPEYIHYRTVKKWSNDGAILYVAGGYLDQPALYLQQCLMCQLAERDHEQALIALEALNRNKNAN